MSFKLAAKFNKADQLPVELMIYQDIGDDPFEEKDGFTAQDFQDALKDIPRDRGLHIRVNSAGGNVWDGLAIKTLINEWPGRKTASIDGMAASVASWLCCDKSIEVQAPRHAQLFIHDAWGMCMGNSTEMAKQAASLDKTSEQIAGIYAAKAGGTVVEWRKRMVDNSLFTAEEAHKLGLVDKLVDSAPVSNFSAIQVRNMKSKLATLNQIRNGEGNPNHDDKGRFASGGGGGKSNPIHDAHSSAQKLANEAHGHKVDAGIASATGKTADAKSFAEKASKAADSASKIANDMPVSNGAHGAAAQANHDAASAHHLAAISIQEDAGGFNGSNRTAESQSHLDKAEEHSERALSHEISILKNNALNSGRGHNNKFFLISRNRETKPKFVLTK